MATYYTEKGEELVTDYTTGAASAPANYYGGWGTGGGTHDKTSTALTTESAESRVAVTETQPAADTAQWVFEMTSASSQSIDEAGIFDANTSGNLHVVSDFTAIALTNGDKIEFTFTLQQS